MGQNLNELRPRRHAGIPWDDTTTGTTAADVTVHFRDVASAAEEFIRSSEMLVGCVAWVRSARLVTALAEHPVALVVNKEFGLRVDGHPERVPLTRLNGGVPGDRIIGAPDRPLEAVRCAGHAAKGRFGALMHHKFLVDIRDGKPARVWTGSFNFTVGAEANFENGMIITDPTVAEGFLEEFSRIWAVSEPLVFAAGKPTPGDSPRTARQPVVRAKKKKQPAKRKAKTTRTRSSARRRPTTKTAKPTARKRG